MKATLGWLREFVEIEMDPADLAQKLTMAGVECTASIEGELDGIVVGEILEIEPHPNADRLRICRVTDGKEVFPVVCGATNVGKGHKVPLAKVGSKLPGGLWIESSEIRGIDSMGMLCSEKELECGEDQSGIWILPEDTRVGIRVDEAMGLKDWVFNFDLTPNRGDCLSIIGLAQEISAITCMPMKKRKVILREQNPPVHESFSVSISDIDLCPRYVAKIVEGVKIAPSPLWVRRRLQLVGQRPINNVVDVTNYVMWELGQPLHAFDLHLLEGKKIVVKRAGDTGTFLTLDGKVRKLKEDMLLIWDGEKPVAIAGVMGGMNSEVTEDTKDVLIESAYFNPMSIRRTSKTLGLMSEASRRFERGVDPTGCLDAANRAAELMAMISGGRIRKGAIDCYPFPVEAKEISLRIDRVNRYLGLNIDHGEIRKILKRLGFKILKSSKSRIYCLPPGRRLEDIKREEDLIEEIARIMGYENIPTTLPRTRIVSLGGMRSLMWENLARNVLVSLGFTEIISYSFISRSFFDSLLLPSEDFRRNAIPLMNPLGEDMSIMRTTLIPGLLSVAGWNVRHKNTDLKLFEIGRIFIPSKSGPLPEEKTMLAGLVMGKRYDDIWCMPNEDVEFYDIKGPIEYLLRRLGIEECEFIPEEEIPFLEKGRSCSIVKGQEILGFIGELVEEVIENFDLQERCFIFDVSIDSLSRIATGERKFKEISKFPPVMRDISIILDSAIPSAEVVKEIKSMGIEWLEKVYVFDRYKGKQIPEGKQGLGIRICYHSMDKNLTDAEVNEIHEMVIEKIKGRFGARLR